MSDDVEIKITHKIPASLGKALDDVDDKVVKMTGNVTKLDDAFSKLGKNNLVNQLIKQETELAKANARLNESTAKVTNAQSRAATVTQKLRDGAVKLATQKAKLAKATADSATAAAKEAAANEKLFNSINAVLTKQELRQKALLDLKIKQEKYKQAVLKTSDSLRKHAEEERRLAEGTDRASEALRRKIAAEERARKRTLSLSDAIRQQTLRYAALTRALRTLTIAFGLREIGQAADRFTNLENRLRQVTKGTEQLAMVSSEIVTIANQTGIAIDEVAVSFQRFDLALQELGATQEESLRFTETLSKASILSGLSAQEAANGIRQLSQALNKGKLDGDEFRSVAENLPLVSKAIADELGVARSELIALAPQGVITSEIIRGALADLANDVDKRFESVTLNLSQSVASFVNNFSKALNQFDKSTGIISAAGAGIRGLGELIPEVAKGFGVLAVAVAAYGTQAAIAGRKTNFLAADVGKLFAVINKNPFVALAAGTAALVLFSDKIEVATTSGLKLSDVFDGIVDTLSDTDKQVSKTAIVLGELGRIGENSLNGLAIAITEWSHALGLIDINQLEEEQARLNKEQKDNLETQRKQTLAVRQIVAEEKKRKALNDQLIAQDKARIKAIKERRALVSAAIGLDAIKQEFKILSDLRKEFKETDLSYKQFLRGVATTNFGSTINEMEDLLKASKTLDQALIFDNATQGIMEVEAQFDQLINAIDDDFIVLAKAAGRSEEEIKKLKDQLIFFKNEASKTEALKSGIDIIDQVRNKFRETNTELDALNNLFLAGKISAEEFFKAFDLSKAGQELASLKQSLSSSAGVDADLRFSLVSEEEQKKLKSQLDFLDNLDKQFNTGVGTSLISPERIAELKEAAKKAQKARIEAARQGIFEANQESAQQQQAGRIEGVFNQQVNQLEQQQQDNFSTSGDVIDTERFDAINKARLEAERKFQEDLFKLRRLFGKREDETLKQQMERRVQNTARLLGTLSDLFAQFNEDGEARNKAAFAAEKALALASATVNVAQAITKANDGTPAGAIRAAQVAVAGGIQIGQIIATAIEGFANGGFIGGNGGPRADDQLIAASTGEFVVNAASAKANAALLEIINRARGPLSTTGAGGGAQRTFGPTNIPTTDSNNNTSSGSNVNVNIFAEAGLDVETEEVEGSDGTDFNVFVKRVDAALASQFRSNSGELTREIKKQKTQGF